MDKLGQIRIVLFFSIIFFFSVSVYLLNWAIFDINDSQRALEKNSSTHLDISEFRFEKDVLILFGVTISFVFFFGLIAVHIKSVCMLLFYSTTGCGMFILLLLILYVESVVSTAGLIILTIANLSSALLATYYAFYEIESINYKSMLDKPYIVNLI